METTALDKGRWTPPAGWPAMSRQQCREMLTAPGQRFEMEEVEIRGVRLKRVAAVGGRRDAEYLAALSRLLQSVEKVAGCSRSRRVRGLVSSVLHCCRRVRVRSILL